MQAVPQTPWMVVDERKVGRWCTVSELGARLVVPDAEDEPNAMFRMLVPHGQAVIDRTHGDDTRRQGR